MRLSRSREELLEPLKSTRRVLAQGGERVCLRFVSKSPNAQTVRHRPARILKLGWLWRRERRAFAGQFQRDLCHVLDRGNAGTSTRYDDTGRQKTVLADPFQMGVDQAKYVREAVGDDLVQ